MVFLDKSVLKTIQVRPYDECPPQNDDVVSVHLMSFFHKTYQKFLQKYYFVYSVYFATGIFPNSSLNGPLKYKHCSSCTFLKSYYGSVLFYVFIFSGGEVKSNLLH
jgi:hypothetical protein